MTYEELEGRELTVNLFGEIYKVSFCLEKYQNGGRVALRAILDNREPFGMLTVNIPEARIGDGEIIVKTWSENEPLAEAALASGLFIDTGKRIPTGHVFAQVWRLS